MLYMHVMCLTRLTDSLEHRMHLMLILCDVPYFELSMVYYVCGKIC